LMLSSHQGTASMGILLTVGLTFTLVCTLVILPVLLRAPAPGVVREYSEQARLRKWVGNEFVFESL